MKEAEMKVLVCGGRSYGVDNTPRGASPAAREAGAQKARAERLVVEEALNLINETRGPITQIIHGDAAGADKLGERWGYARRIKVRAFKANWSKYGQSAGPIRNAEMLTIGKPDLVVAFPGHVGTADMVLKARAAGITVITFG